ncbi:Uncharacterized protein Fot_24902 [Forsythia ovata]|uniref:Uncharacterized protein n=1 Tax=Forsythia ovata TaxID=205694 RepID=A0ABD1U7I1_9LAMI
MAMRKNRSRFVGEILRLSHSAPTHRIRGYGIGYQGGIVEMLFKFMCCVDEESDHATRIRTKAKKIAVSIPDAFFDKQMGNISMLVYYNSEWDQSRSYNDYSVVLLASKISLIGSG